MVSWEKLISNRTKQGCPGIVPFSMKWALQWRKRKAPPRQTCLARYPTEGRPQKGRLCGASRPATNAPHEARMRRSGFWTGRLMCARIRSQGLATACSGCSGLGQHQSAEECIPAPSQVGSLQGQCDGSGKIGVQWQCRWEGACFTDPSYAYLGQLKEGIQRSGC